MDPINVAELKLHAQQADLEAKRWSQRAKKLKQQLKWAKLYPQDALEDDDAGSSYYPMRSSRAAMAPQKPGLALVPTSRGVIDTVAKVARVLPTIRTVTDLQKLLRLVPHSKPGIFNRLVTEGDKYLRALDRQKPPLQPYAEDEADLLDEEPGLEDEEDLYQPQIPVAAPYGWPQQQQQQQQLPQQFAPPHPYAAQQQRNPNTATVEEVTDDPSGGAMVPYGSSRGYSPQQQQYMAYIAQQQQLQQQQQQQQQPQQQQPYPGCYTVPLMSHPAAAQGRYPQIAAY